MKKSLALFAALTLLSTPSYAHVTANPDNGAAGDYFQTSFRIAHGCEGDSATTSVHIKIPAGFASVRAQAKPGWNVSVLKHKLAKPIPAGHGKMSDEEVTDVIWSGGNLPDDQYDEFGILTKLPDAPQTLWFPVIQECKSGKNEWVQIPSKGQEWHDLKNPAPFVRVGKKAAMDHDMSGMDMGGMNMPGMDQHAH